MKAEEKIVLMMTSEERKVIQNLYDLLDNFGYYSHSEMGELFFGIARNHNDVLQGVDSRLILEED